MAAFTGFILGKKRQSELTLKNYGSLRLLEASKKIGVDLIAVSPEQIDWAASHHQRGTIFVDNIEQPMPDFVIPRLGSETSYSALALIRHFESRGVYCCNGSAAIRNAQDKLSAYQILSNHHLPIPKTLIAKYPVNINMVKRELDFPLIVRNPVGSRGKGICLCLCEDSFLDQVSLIHSVNPAANLLLQEYVHASYGKDLRVFIIGSKVAGCMLRQAKSGFKANYSLGGTVEPYPLNDEIEEISLKAANAVGLDIAGVDLLFDGTGYKICEVNSSPGFEGLEYAIGTGIAEQMLEFIHKQTQELVFGNAKALAAPGLWRSQKSNS